MPSIDVEVEIEIYCSCGNGLCNQSSGGHTRGRGQPYFTVEPCEKCIDKAKDEGYQEAKKEAEAQQ